MDQFKEGDQASEDRKRYQKTAKVLTLFIVSYLTQWHLFIVYSIWTFIEVPPYLLVSTVSPLDFETPDKPNEAAKTLSVSTK